MSRAAHLEALDRAHIQCVLFANLIAEAEGARRRTLDAVRYCSDLDREFEALAVAGEVLRGLHRLALRVPGHLADYRQGV